MEQPPSRHLTEAEIIEIRVRCQSLQLPSEPTPQLLACLQHWSEQDAKARRRADDGGS